MFRVNPNGQCKSCHRPVVFAIDDEGKNQILDPRPPIYDVTLSEDKRTVLALRNMIAMVSHFTTCNDPGRFSKRK